MAGLFIMRGAAPPPSRKLTDSPMEPPWFVDNNPPLKYGRRLTFVPLTVPGARIPGTLMPTFGMVSAKVSEAREDGGSRPTVADDSSVDDESQQGHLVCGSVVLQQCGGVVVADGSVGRALGNSRANGCRDGESLEKHDCDCKVGSRIG